MINAQFDMSTNQATAMNRELWCKCYTSLMELLKVLKNPVDKSTASFTLPQGVATRPVVVVPTEEEANLDNASKEYFLVPGSAVLLCERLDNEYRKNLQELDPHKMDFIERLKDEGDVYNLICAVENYVQTLPRSATTIDELCRIRIKRVEHLYYKTDYKSMSVNSGTEDITSKKNKPEEKEMKADDSSSSLKDSEFYVNAIDKDAEADPAKLVDVLCKKLYADASGDIRTRAMLCHIYHHALHKRWYEARDMMLMSGLQDEISHADLDTQILYNRALVQLGI
eukprot:UC4_evm1s150